MIPERAYADNVSFCATVTGAPAEECEALMNIYDTTGGEDWTDITGWGTSTTICAWTGVTCSDNHITALDLSGKNLKGDFVVTTGNLNALTYLNLSSNGLTSVDSRGLNSLQTLEIQNNLFTTFSGTWPKVTYLDISSNQLVSFDGA